MFDVTGAYPIQIRIIGSTPFYSHYPYYISLYPHNCWSLWFYHNLLPTNIYKFRHITGFLHHFAIFFSMFYGDTSIICQPGRRWGGEACPICSLGECGDVNCPSYRPKRPEVRQAVEETVLQHAVWLGEPWEMDIWLVVWNMAFIFQFIYGYGYIIYIYGIINPSHWRTHIFQRGRYTTNQIWIWMGKHSIKTDKDVMK